VGVDKITIGVKVHFARLCYKFTNLAYSLEKTVKITVLNGDPDSNNKIEDYLHELSSLLVSRKHVVKIFDLSEMDMKYCIGCFYCWTKTPDKCFVEDDSNIICREYMSSDFVLFASLIIMGFTSVILKKIHDKLLPLCIPYARLLDQRVRHKPRYDKYPRIGV
jgi:multimeric flavodoxin WrbA